MATPLANALTIIENNLWRGGSRVVVGPLASPPTFPVKIEDVLTLTTMTLKTGYTDVGALTADGVTMTPSFDKTEGVEVDQRDANIGGGEVTNFAQQVGFTTVDTSIDNLRMGWGLPAPTTLAAVPGTNVEQKIINVDGLESLPSRIVVVLQQHAKSGKMRVFAFRQAELASAGEIAISKNTSQLQMTFDIKADESISTGNGRYYKIFYEV